MGRHRVATSLAILTCSGLLWSCGRGFSNPTAPSADSSDVQPAAASISNHLFLQSSSIEETGRNSTGQWLYKATTVVRNQITTGLTVTAYQVQIITGTTGVANGSTAPYVWVPAYASQNLVLTFASGTHLQLGTLTWNVKVGYKDRYGNTGSVSGQFTDDPCYGCWDYSLAHVAR
jgi:hypothetical protein